MAEKDNINNLVLFDTVKKEVAYHNDFSNAVFTNFSRKEKQLLLFLIAGIKGDDSDEKIYHFNPKEVKSQLNFTRQNYKVLANLVDSMGAKPLVIFKSNKELEKIYIFDKVTYKTSDESIRIIWGKSAIKLFKNLTGNFSKYFLKNILNLQTENSIEFYLKAESNLFKGSFDISIEDIKTIFDVNYITPGDIKRNIINRCVKDINANTDISVEVENIKEGKSVKGFTFKIQRKNLLTDDLLKCVEKAKKNIWISKSGLFNRSEIEKTIHTLLRTFTISELKQGLSLCHESIKNEFKQISYLEQAIKYTLKNSKSKTEVKVQKTLEQVIEKSLVTKDKNKKNQDIEELFSNFEKLDLKSQEKIEETALNTYIKENDVNKNFLKGMKEKSPTIYYNSLKNCIVEAMKKNMDTEKNINISENNKVSTPKKRGRRKKIDMIDELNKTVEITKNEKAIKSFMKKKYGKEKMSELLENMDTYEEIMFTEYINLLKEKENKKK